MKTVPTASVSDQIREHISKVYVNNALRRGETIFTANVGTVQKALKLVNRAAQVCSALESKKLLQQNRMRIVSKTGPPSGQSTSVIYTYEILPNRNETADANPFTSLRGLAKDIFKELGGGETFIRNERSKLADHKER